MKILVGYRGTNVGKDLLELAANHARAFAGEVLVITSLPGGDKTGVEAVKDAEEKLEEAKQYLTDRNIRHETHLLIRGNTPGEDLVSFAAETSCSEIIIGVKSRSKVGKILFGSTAQYVILKAGCPVVSMK